MPSTITISAVDNQEITYSQIHELVYLAHSSNREKGLFYRTADYDGEYIKNKVTPGVTYVAIEETKLIGTGSINLYKGRNWYDYGLLVAHYCFDAVLPAYQGKGVMKLIDEKRDLYSFHSGVKVIRSGTAVNNVIQRKRYKRQGFVPVDYRRFQGNNFYSVIYVKWLDRSCRRSALERILRFSFKVVYTRVTYRVRRICELVHK